MYRRHNKIMPVLTLFFFLTAVCLSTPRIQFETTSHDFGNIDQNQKMKYTFKFTNTGNSDLIINDSKSSCECTAAALVNKPIPPNGTGEITVTMDGGPEPGKKEETVMLYFNDSAHSPLKLTITATVVPEVLVTPTELNFGTIASGDKQTKYLTLSDKKRGSLKVEKLTIPNPNITAVVDPSKSKNPGEVVVAVTVTPSLQVGKFNQSLSIQTDNKTRPTQEVMIFGEVKGEISIIPDKLYFGIVKKGEKPSKSITLTGGAKFSITKVDSPVKGLIIQVPLSKNESKYELKATLDSTISPNQVIGNVILYTSSTKQPQITIPLYGLVR